ncbi:MAG TPA: TIGR01459 family HAD-type hydrolase [Sphingomicrobium sp.]|nr:TIGR01459 family HAD-type hydrolase [Sphingomicrobium sp.]
MPLLDRVAEPFSTILCDIWGVVHDGAHLLPGATERLLAWKRSSKRIILITNAPRSAATVQHDLDRIGLPRAAYDAITSGGQAGMAALIDPPRGVGFLGTADDRSDLVDQGVQIAPQNFSELACTGLDEDRDDPADYRAQLAAWAGEGVLMHCLNPDRTVIHCGVREACAGALADIYEDLGGKVAWYGKPHPPIYAHALRLAGDPPLNHVLAIGDGLVTDMLGAARAGIAAIFVTGGIHSGEPFPADFAARYNLADWRPLLIVTDLS